MKVKIGLIQMSMEQEVNKNIEKAMNQIKNAAKKGANIVCLPEIFTSPYFPQIENANAKDHAIEIPSILTNQLSALAKELKIVLVAGSIFEKNEGKFYNTSLVYDTDGKLLGKYRKMHIPHDPSFYEQNYFEKGNLDYQVFDTKFGKIAPAICYDQWFPEVARILALKGAQIIFYPTAIGTVKGVEEVEGDWQTAWRIAQMGHAVVNGIIVAAVNRTGSEGEMNFWGGSFITQFGKLFNKITNQEEIIICEVDLSLNDKIKQGWRFFKERRPETYKEITKKVQ